MAVGIFDEYICNQILNSHIHCNPSKIMYWFVCKVSENWCVIIPALLSLMLSFAILKVAVFDMLLHYPIHLCSRSEWQEMPFVYLHKPGIAEGISHLIDYGHCNN